MTRRASQPERKPRRTSVPPIDDRYALSNVEEIRLRFRLPAATLTRFRALAAKDPETDPWIGNYTRPHEFHVWLWHERKRLEKLHPTLAEPKPKPGE
jgi:hypothetical protein